MEKTLDISRQAGFDAKVLIIDGLPGCGKTMLSPIVSAMERVEKLSYSFEMELMCQLHSLRKIDDTTAEAMVKTFIDFKLYYTMMSRDVNFRWGDLSSVFRDGQPLRYIKRLFGPGDETIPQRVKMERPIFHLTTHHLLGIGQPIFAALGSRLLFVEVVRHPLYMIKQQALNIDKLIGDVRYPAVHVHYKDKELPWWTKGWEDDFVKSNNAERAAFSLIWMTKYAQENKQTLSREKLERLLTIPFESFVLNPDPYLKIILDKLETKMTPLTYRMMRRQRVPRTKIAAGIDLAIYRRCGWKPAQASVSEEEELAERRNWLKAQVNPQVLGQFDAYCHQYEKLYMPGLQQIPGR